MQTISELKEQQVTDAPILLFDCVLSSGDAEHWSTHAVSIANTAYDARVLQHSAFDIQTASDQGIDGSPKISLLLANADAHFSEIERATGWKGARLTVSFVFYDLINAAALTDAVVIFQGICNPPEQIREATFRISAINRMNLQRLLLPEVRIQRRCPWTFPATAAQQIEAVDGGSNGMYSPYYRCGYSAGQVGGSGSLDGGVPFSSCGYTRTDCATRGLSQRFGGLDFVPPVIAVRGYGKDWSSSALSINQARYNDFLPMVYGTGWYEPLVSFARNDGNLTRMEVLLGIGPMQGVLTVLVNDVEIPMGISGVNMTGTGWYNVMSLGSRDGCYDTNFADSNGNPAGDPYGSMAYLAVVVPNQLNDGNALPSVKVLVQGLQVPTYAADATSLGYQFTNNPAWILLDILRRTGWTVAELDLASFAQAAAYCDQQISSTDLNGNTISIARFHCNVLIQKRRSAGDLIRGIRSAARLFLTYGSGGELQLKVENSIALQQPTQNLYSNSTSQLNGGWPAYEFGDGTNGFSGILRKSNGEPTVTISSRGIADTPNCLTIDFQDELNGYQQDSYTIVDPCDVTSAGQQVTSTLMALGLPNYDQAARILQVTLDKLVKGNTYIEFETSIKGFGISPGDIITLTYLNQGFNRQPFRVLKISPATNYRSCTITAQIHDDAWYSDSNGQPTSAPGSTQTTGSSIGLPKPLVGSVIDSNGNMQVGVTEIDAVQSDGSIVANLAVCFATPKAVTNPTGMTAPGAPLINLVAAVQCGGSLRAGQPLYYAVSALDDAANESALSFLVPIVITQDGSSVVLSGLSFSPGTASFNVYRGTTPANLLQIACNQAISATFTDSGLADMLIPPPDANFDHANFYWRMEQQPEVGVSYCSATVIGNETLQMAMNQYRGSTVRITRGMGAGQERTVAANDQTSLTVSSPFAIEPNSTSWFVVAEGSWHFGAVTKSSPVHFAVPNLAGEFIEVTGRSANVNNVECSPDLSIVTRWQIGGSGNSDADVPPAPFFGLTLGQSGGVVELSGVSFADLTNTSTISSATLTLYYWNEIQGTPSTTLGAGLGASDTTLQLISAGTPAVGTVLQIETELLKITAAGTLGGSFTVERGIIGSQATTHSLGTTVFRLAATTVIAPFPDGFFGSPYSGTWAYPVLLPDVRIAGGQLYVTNQRGNSPTTSIAVTHSAGFGLRTLAGGQYSIQVPGYLAVDQSAAPTLIVDSARSLRDVFAVLGTAADQTIQLQLNRNGQMYCQLTFVQGSTISQTIDGSTLPPLAAGDQLTLSILSTGQLLPGADLTVVIRL